MQQSFTYQKKKVSHKTTHFYSKPFFHPFCETFSDNKKNPSPSKNLPKTLITPTPNKSNQIRLTHQAHNSDLSPRERRPHGPDKSHLLGRGREICEQLKTAWQSARSSSSGKASGQDTSCCKINTGENRNGAPHTAPTPTRPTRPL